MTTELKYTNAVKWFESKGYEAYWINYTGFKFRLYIHCYNSDGDDWIELEITDDEVTTRSELYDELQEEK